MLVRRLAAGLTDRPKPSPAPAPAGPRPWRWARREASPRRRPSTPASCWTPWRSTTTTLPNGVNPRAGDILFFDGAEHVAIAVGGNRDMYTLFNRDPQGQQDLDAPYIVGDIDATANGMALMQGVTSAACPF